MQAQTVHDSTVGATEPGGATDQYLTFLLGDEEFGVDILRVQEIKGWEAVTAIPNTPDYICGVMNLRGTVIPIVDLRMRFGLDSAEYLARTVVIVLRIEGEMSTRTMGFVVDAVSEVYNVTVENLQPAPDFGARVNTQFIRGLAIVDGKMIVLLDVDRLISLDSVFSAVEELTDQPPLAAPSVQRTE